MKKHRVYLDNCCFNRPYDDQSFETVRLETQAKLFVQTTIKDGRTDLVWSFIIDFENAANPFEDQKISIMEWRDICVEIVKPDEAIRDLANSLATSCKMKSKDSLHIACAIKSGCDFFITTDRRLIKQAVKIKGIQVLNPIDFVTTHLEVRK